VKSSSAQVVDTVSADALSIALISPDEQNRIALANALAGPEVGLTRVYSQYPALDDVPRLTERNHDVIIVDLDSNPEDALDLVEGICACGAATVMVYSVRADSDLMIRCMRAGAREFLTQPLTPTSMAEALVRASVRRPAIRPPKKTGMRSKPILMLTTEGLATKKEEGKAAGATGWIVKPFDPEKLLATVAKVLP